MNLSFRLSTLAVLLFGLFLISCNSSEESINNNSIVGEWQHTERAYSIGAGLIVDDIQDGEIYEIREDGSFTYELVGRASGTWEISSDEILNFEFNDEVADRIVNFNYEIEGDVLTLTPAFVFFTEGCYDKYTRR